VSHSKTKLVLRTDPLMAAYIGVAFALSILVTVLIRRAAGDMAHGIVSVGIYTLAVVASTLLVGLSARGIRSETTYTFCRESGHLTIRTAILWWSRTKRHLLQDIAAVVLGKEGDKHYWVELKLKSGEGILLRASDGERVAEIAEHISTLLDKPLLYDIAGAGAHLRASTADIGSPAHCPDCGAPVRFPGPGQPGYLVVEHMTCAYCGAVLPVKWKADQPETTGASTQERYQ